MPEREAPRTMWVVDLEHVVLEVAAVNLSTGRTLEFVPYLHPEDLKAADPAALQLNRYFERGLFKRQLSAQETADRYRELFDTLKGQRFGGANPRFDALMLCHAMGRSNAGWGNAGVPRTSYQPAEEPWHYRLADVSAYVAGACGVEPEDIPSLAECCTILRVERNQEHTAVADARAAAECFRCASERVRGDLKAVAHA